MHCTIHIDGGARGNPGPAAAGVIIVNAENDQPVLEAGYFLGKATNNVAEYTGLLRALEAAQQLGADPIEVFSDSELMVKQVHGQYRVKSPDLKPLFQQAMQHFRHFNQWTLTHVRRDKNQRADQLANAAMDAAADVVYTG